MTTRRGFVRACASMACACWFGPLMGLASKGDDGAAALPAVNRDEAFALQWITELLDSLSGCDLTEEQLRAVVKASAQAHFDLLDVPQMVRPYVGKPDEFIEFLQNAWGWVVTDDKAARMLIVDENKPVCVCPLLKHAAGRLFPALCYCSEGFAEKMFGCVYERPVSAVVARSIQRGDPTCVYNIKY